MPSNGEPCAGVFSRPVFTRAGRLAIGFASLAIATAPCAIGLAAAQDVAPVVSPERIEDVPSTRVDPFPEFDNFAWRAFIALNWPSLTDAAHRGVPDRAKTLGDPGPRVWETFKARYELFQVGPDGRPIAPQPWATYEAREPLRSGCRRIARKRSRPSIHSWISINPPSCRAWPPIRWWRRIGTYTRYEMRINEPEYSALALQRLEPGPEPARSGPSCANCPRARSRSRPHGGRSPRRTRRRCGRAITWSRTPMSSTSPRRSPPAVSSVRKATSRWSACTS